MAYGKVLVLRMKPEHLEDGDEFRQEIYDGLNVMTRLTVLAIEIPETMLPDQFREMVENVIHTNNLARIVVGYGSGKLDGTVTITSTAKR